MANLTVRRSLRGRNPVRPGLTPDRGGSNPPVEGSARLTPVRFGTPRVGAASRAQIACDPRCAQPVVRFSIHEKSSYMAMAIAPMVTSPAKASDMRCCEPAVCIR